MKIYIESKKPVHEGAGVSIKLSLCSDSGERASADIVISFDDYFILSEHIKEGEITEEFFSVLEEKGRIYSAFSYGMYLLGFGQCTRKRLVAKLERKGHDRESAETAADMLVHAGYIDEYDLAHCAMLHACNDKHYGRRRIIADLYEKGFSREIIQQAFRLFEGELDYDEAKRKLLLAKFGSEEPVAADAKEKQKIMSVLYRYGH